MRLGVVLLPDLSWAQARARWRAAEQAGVATSWTYDHLSWRSLRDGPWLGSVPLLAAAAASTTSIRLGTLVTSPNFRHPALLAKDVMTLDRISDGRFDLGVGAGGTGWDAHVLGAPAPGPAERTARFAEFVDALDLLLREPATSYEGRFFRAVDSRTFPGCVQRPRVPFTVAAAGPRALALAARYAATWVTYGGTGAGDDPAAWYAAVGAQAGRLDAACRAIGRDPGEVRRAALVSLDVRWPVQSVGAWEEFTGRLATLGFTDVVVHWPRPDDPDLPGPPPAVFEEILRRC
jgi:alkanesulfonate monooxygenase SsuD/methylene tetrahydromethanopterin reductase-like flavin-dependent oxidoreductase (luciferase family)